MTFLVCYWAFCYNILNVHKLQPTNFSCRNYSKQIIRRYTGTYVYAYMYIDIPKTYLPAVNNGFVCIVRALLKELEQVGKLKSSLGLFFYFFNLDHFFLSFFF